MDWNTLSTPLQACLEEAWVACCQGSLPHGAVVMDGNGVLLSRGHNAAFGSGDGNHLPQSPLLHAEVDALWGLPWKQYPAPQRGNWTLLSLIEPCDMCMGTVLAAHLRQIHYICRDKVAGASAQATTKRYQQRNVVIVGAETPDESILETLLVALQLACVLNMPPLPFKQNWAKAISEDSPEADRIGRYLHESGQIQRWIEEKDIVFVINELSALLQR